MKKLLSAIAGGLLFVSAALAQNPYLPLWEYIPDGEPHVFEDPDNPGKYRVYIYGSHDVLKSEYCGRDQVVWSAPVERPWEWRYDGVIFTCTKDRDGNPLNEGGLGDILYAPDIAFHNNMYYFYPNSQGWRRKAQMAVSKRPDGPFEVVNWSATDPVECDGILGFDPAVFVDDDGRVYGYWGFERSYAVELDPANMYLPKEGAQVVEDMISGCKQDGVFRFFEASSMRKIDGMYVFIYSRMTAEGEFGLPTCNYNLAYAYSESPLGPFTYGGTLIDARARETDADGKVFASACPYGNTHGSIAKLGKQWWVFYHRQTGTDEYNRQAMVAPIDVKIKKQGGRKCVVINEAEVTSEGFRTEGLNPSDLTAAGYACYLYNPHGVGQQYPHFIFSGSYVKAPQGREGLCPVVNNTAGSIVGYKYFNFSGRKYGSVKILLEPLHEGSVTIMIGGPDTQRGGKAVGSLTLGKDDLGAKEFIVPVALPKGIKGKQALYFVFSSPDSGVSICDFYGFQFLEK